MASNLLVMASNLRAMASNLLAIKSDKALWLRLRLERLDLAKTSLIQGTKELQTRRLISILHAQNES